MIGQRELIEQEELVEGRIVIGCGELTAVQVLPEVIEAFHKKYPLVSYDIFTANADQVKERWVVLMRPDDPLAEKEEISAKDLENMPLILPRRRNVQNELSNWLGDSFQNAKVLFTSNLSTNGALMVQRGLTYSIAIEGSVPFWDKEKITYRPLYPELKANSAFAWKKQQPFTLAADKFIEHFKCFLGIGNI